MDLRVAVCLSAFWFDKLDCFKVQLFVDIPTNDCGAEFRILESQLFSHSMACTSNQNDIALYITFDFGECLVNSLDDSEPKLQLQYNDINDDEKSFENRCSDVVGSVKIEVKCFMNLTKFDAAWSLPSVIISHNYYRKWKKYLLAMTPRVCYTEFFSNDWNKMSRKWKTFPFSKNTTRERLSADEFLFADKFNRPPLEYFVWQMLSMNNERQICNFFLLVRGWKVWFK